MTSEEEKVMRFLSEMDKEIIWACELGARTYGFKDSGSDLDLRGVYVEDLSAVIGMDDVDLVIDGEDGIIDYHFLELKKFFKLITRSNFRVIEWVFTPYNYISEYEESIREITEKSISKDIGRHARGWAESIYQMDWNDPKKCLYALRPLMVYINLCREGEWISDMNVLADKLGHEDHISELIRLKKEDKGVPKSLKKKNIRLYRGLVQLSKEEENRSDLPERPLEEARELADQLILDVRLERFSEG